MKAELTSDFKGVKDGDVYPTQFRKGAILEGELAITAIYLGVAKKVGNSAPKQGEPGNEQPSSASQQAPASQQKTAKQRGKDK